MIIVNISRHDIHDIQYFGGYIFNYGLLTAFIFLPPVLLCKDDAIAISTILFVFFALN